MFPNSSLTWTVSLYHTCHNNSMICLLITTNILFYWVNADENGLLHVFSTGNLLNSRSLWQTRACAKEWKCAVHMSTKVAGQVFFFTAKDVDFMHFYIILKYVNIHNILLEISVSKQSILISGLPVEQILKLLLDWNKQGIRFVDSPPYALYGRKVEIVLCILTD